MGLGYTKKNIQLVIPLFLTEPKTGRTRYPTCTNTILGPSLLCGQPARQMVHGNDPLRSPAHSNVRAALPAHARRDNQSLDPFKQDPPSLAPGSANGIGAGAGMSVFFGQPRPPMTESHSPDKVLGGPGFSSKKKMTPPTLDFVNTVYLSLACMCQKQELLL